MPHIRVKLADSLEIPEGAEIVLAATGVVSGIRLPNGEFIKPWISWELFPSSDDDVDPQGDLDEINLSKRGVFTDLDFEREVEVAAGKVDVDNSRVGKFNR